MVFIDFLMVLGGMCKLSNSSILLVCTEPQIHAVMTMRGLTCHPCVLMIFMKGLYLFLLVSVARVVYLVMCECEFYDLDG